MTPECSGEGPQSGKVEVINKGDMSRDDFVIRMYPQTACDPVRRTINVAASAGSSGFQKGCKAFPGINRSNRIYDDFVVHAVYYVN